MNDAPTITPAQLRAALRAHYSYTGAASVWCACGPSWPVTGCATPPVEGWIGHLLGVLAGGL